jgi:hypothetical protein
MQRFNLDPVVVSAMASRPRTVQVEIARLANLKLGCCPDQLCGIAKYEGGVQVNHHDVVIYRDRVGEGDGPAVAEPTPAEVAVVDSILELQAAFRDDPAYLRGGPHQISGDALRELLSLPHDTDHLPED